MNGQTCVTKFVKQENSLWTRPALAALVVLMLLPGAVMAQAPTFGDYLEFNRTARIGVADVAGGGSASGSAKATAFGTIDNNTSIDMAVGYMTSNWNSGNSAVYRIDIYYNSGNPSSWGSPTTLTFTAGAISNSPITHYDYYTEKFDTIEDIAIADIDGDGMNDIVFCNHVDGVMWFRQTSWGFWSGTPYSILGRNTTYNYYQNCRRILVVNTDGDTPNEVIVARGETDSTTGFNSTGRVSVFNRSGALPFTWTESSIENFTGSAQFPVSLRAADLAGDSKLDLVVCWKGSNTVKWYLNNGSGGFSSITPSGVVHDEPYDTGFADVNKDGNLDIIVAQRNNTGNGASVRVLLNDARKTDSSNFTGVGTVSNAYQGYRNGSDTYDTTYNDKYPIFVQGGDFDQDGDGDFFVSWNRLSASPAGALTNGNVVFFQNANGAGTSWNEYPLYTQTSPVNLNNPADTGPMQMVLAMAAPSATNASGFADTFPDLAVYNRTSKTLSFWNQTTYVRAPYLTNLAVIGGRTVDLTFSQAMNTTDLATFGYYTASGSGIGSLLPNPTGVADQGANKYRLTWSAGQLQLGGQLFMTADVAFRDALGYRIHKPRVLDVTVTDTTDPTAICKDIPITLDTTTWTVNAGDIDNGSFDNFAIASYLIRGVPSGSFAPSFTYDCSHLPHQTATLRVTDTSGRTAECNALVTISATLQVQVISPALPVTKYELYLGDNLPAALQVQAICGITPYAFQWQYSANVDFTSPSNINGPFHPLDGSVPVTIGGATPNSTLNFGPMTSLVDGYYRCSVTDSKTPTPVTDESDPTQVSVRSDVTADPAMGAGFYHTNDEVVFSVTGHNGYSDAPYTFAWYKTGNPTPITTGGRFVVGGASPSSTLTIDPVQKTDAGSYYCVVTDRVATGSGSTATSDAAAITVLDLFEVSGPLPADALLYGTAQDFEVTATGGDENYTFAWEWDQDGTFGAGTGGALNHGAAHPNSPPTSVTVDNSIPGKSRLTLSPIATTSADGYYRCVVGEGGPDADIPSGASRLRRGFQLSVALAKTLPALGSPQNYLNPLRLTATPSGGFAPYEYQWALSTDGGVNFNNLSDGTTVYSRPGRDGLESLGDFTVDVAVTITGATGPVLDIDHPLTGLHAGRYRCTVTDDLYPAQQPQSIGQAILDVNVEEGVAIIRQPVGGEYYNGNQHQLDMAVTGGTPLSYTFSWLIGPNGILNSAVNPLEFIAKSGPYPGGPFTHQASLIDTTGYSFPNYKGSITSSGLNTDVSNTVAIVVRDAVNFPNPPADQEKNVTESVTFTAVAAGGYPDLDGYDYVWTFGGNTITDGARPSGSEASGAKTASLTITDLKMADAGAYEVTAKDGKWPCDDDADKCIATYEVVLTVNNDIRVTDDPDSLEVYAGDDVSFSVTAGGGVPAEYSYEWYWENALYETQLHNGSHPSNTGALVDAATTSTVTIQGVQTGPAPDTQDSGEYYAVVRDGSGNAPGTSNPATLGVYPPVTITASPAPQNKYGTETATFSVTATGGIRGERSFLWQRDTTGTGSSFVDLANDGVISGATSANLSVASLTLADDGDLFRCVVTAPDSDVATDPENLTQESGSALLQVSAPLNILGVPANMRAYVTDPAFDLHVNFENGMPPYASDWRRTGVNPVVLEASAGPGTIVLGSPNVASLTVNPSALTPGIYSYAVQLTDEVKMTRSGSGSVEIANKLKFVRGLTNSFVRARQRFDWSIQVSGGLGQIEHQWSKSDGTKAFVPLVNDATHQGVTTAMLKFLDVDFDDAGLYQVEVSDDFMEIRSQATLEVGEALPAAGLLGLVMLAAGSAAVGALRLRRREER